MAVGDTIYKFSGTIAHTNSWTLQPPANETWVITTIVGGGASSNVHLHDGSVDHILWNLPAASQPTPCRIFINNSYYLRIYNGSGGDLTFAVTGQIIGDVNGFMDGILGVAISVLDPYGTTTVRPSAGGEWIITALQAAPEWEMADGSTTMALSVPSAHGESNQLAIWVTNSNYLQCDTHALAYSGIIAKQST